MLKLIECPRDAMQGIHEYIPIELKVKYINLLLKCGFHTIDFGSFVSERAIPQLKDTAQVLENLELEYTKSKLLAIVANVRGAETAAGFSEISYLGYPFSLSETFQQRNTNRSMNAAYEDILLIQDICSSNEKELVVYFSMGFGNPYGDTWNADIVMLWMEKLSNDGIKIFSLADTVGTADPKDIESVYGMVTHRHPDLEIGAHFHASQPDQHLKVEAAWKAGCRRFDMAMMGFGGCPMAEDELVGNISTEFMMQFLAQKGQQTGIDQTALVAAKAVAGEIFGAYK